MGVPRRISEDWLDDTAGLLPEADLDEAELAEFVFERWKERAAEYGRPTPTDLSSSCKFSSLFVKVLYGGRIEGNFSH